MKSIFAALMTLMLVLGPVGQVLATCCAAASMDHSLSAAAVTEAVPDQPPCHGDQATTVSADPAEPDNRHQHDCSSALDCCGAAASALADAPTHVVLTATHVQLPLGEATAPRHMPHSLYRPPRIL